METREMIRQAREKGVTIKAISDITNINLKTLYRGVLSVLCLKSLLKKKFLNGISS